MKRNLGLVFLAVVGLVSGGCAHCDRARSDTLTQFSVIDALMAGAFDGQVSCGRVLQSGDFGLGTFDALDGEMVVLDGRVFRVPYDGQVREVSPGEPTPYAAVTFFEPDVQFELLGLKYPDFQNAVAARFPSPNLLYAIRVDGSFSYVKTRSVPRQPKPYPTLAKAVEAQSVFEMKDVRGTLVGLWGPSFIKGVGVPGFHFHFLDETRTRGGHVLDLEMKQGKVGIDTTSGLQVLLSEDPGFLSADLTRGAAGDLNAVEKGKGH